MMRTFLILALIAASAGAGAACVYFAMEQLTPAEVRHG